MLKKTTYALLALSIIGSTSCSRIDDLESDLDELKKDYKELEDEQTRLAEEQDKLKLSYETLSESLSDLQTDVGLIDTDLQKFVGDVAKDIESLQNNISSDKVFWGDVATYEQFAALEAGKYLQVSGSINVTSDDQLSKISSVVYVGGALSIENVSGVNLKELQVVSGNLYIGDITAADTEIDFPALTSLGGDLALNGHDAHELVALRIPTLQLIGGNFNVDMGSPEGFRSADNVLSELIIPATIVGGDFNLEMTSELPGVNTDALRVVAGNVNLSNNYKLSLGVTSFTNLESIGGGVRLFNNSEGQDVGGSSEQGQLASTNSDDFVTIFPKVTSINGNFYFDSNNYLEKLKAFDATTVLKGDFHFNYYALEQFSGFKALKTIEGDFYWYSSEGTSGVIGFDVLEEVEGYFELTAFQAFGFNALTEVYDHFSVTGSKIPTFNSFAAVSNLTGTYPLVNVQLLGATNENIFPAFSMDTDGAIGISYQNYLGEINDITLTGFGKARKLDNLTLDLSNAGTIANLNIFPALTDVGGEFGLYNENVFFTVKFSAGNNPNLACFTELFKHRIYFSERYNVEKAIYDVEYPLYLAWKKEFYDPIYAQYELDLKEWEDAGSVGDAPEYPYPERSAPNEPRAANYTTNYNILEASDGGGMIGVGVQPQFGFGGGDTDHCPEDLVGMKAAFAQFANIAEGDWFDPNYTLEEQPAN